MFAMSALRSISPCASWLYFFETHSTEMTTPSGKVARKSMSVPFEPFALDTMSAPSTCR